MYAYQSVPYEAGRNVALENHERTGKTSPWVSFKSWRTKRRTTLGASCAVAALTFILNITATVYLYRHSAHDPGATEPINPRLFVGSCSKAQQLNRGVHIVINTLSTLLLSSSNMFMQLLLAPTRAEVDTMHQKQRWVDVGIPNLRNLRYNSAIYMARPMNHVKMHIVAPEFLTGAPVSVDNAAWMYGWRREQNLTGLERKHTNHRKLVSQAIDSDSLFNWNMACDTDNCSSVQQYAMDQQYQRRLNPFDCLTAYSSIYGNRSDVIFVSRYDYLWNSSTSIPHVSVNNDSSLIISNDASELSNPIENSLLFAKELKDVMVVGFWMDYDWLCGTTNSFDCRRPTAWLKNPSIVDDWNILGWKIDECLVREVPLEEKCSVLSNEDPMAKPLSTIGDAISSFLAIPDPTTMQLGLADKTALSNQKTPWPLGQTYTWSLNRSRWYRLVTKKRLVYTFILWLGIVLGGAGSMIQNFYLITARSGSASHILDYAFGDTDQYTFGQLGLDITPARASLIKGFLSIVFFANMWQVLLSLLYMSLNALLTCFCVEAEWQSYALTRKPLRVSSPAAGQRSTYFLSLPLRYAVPLTATFTALHWMLSQSIFLTVVAVYDPRGFTTELLFLGSSPRPLIIKQRHANPLPRVAVAIGTLLGIAIAGICLRTSIGNLPRGGSCSAIISAACHSGPCGDTDLRKPVQWGEIATDDARLAGHRTPSPWPYAHSAKLPDVHASLLVGTDHDRVGHCCFSALEVRRPREGRRYW
ncbi:hypothetical protein BDV95DRAFT_595268 [Massariosphaeria phaeospora]|uniref:DUF6536 domain-containing protein n=1 Tax=Massariosphaeria phaeospora TaxID=100035 RepID=A0A7C8I6I2_9PLEO|nr:hypothetical protein BDV95DRAFT_595268 [Massariosphaeria phaeospora]